MQNDLRAFYEACKNNMLNSGYQALNEEFFASTVGLKKEAYKLLCKRSSGELQVSYFMILTELTEKGYGYGCITAFPNEDHGIAEGYIIEMINNWEYR